jgi:hypothetical protein
MCGTRPVRGSPIVEPDAEPKLLVVVTMYEVSE